MKLYYPNLNFEDEISGHKGTASVTTRQTVEELSHAVAFLATEGDHVLLPEGFRLPECLADTGINVVYDFGEAGAASLVPWGWTHEAKTIAERTHSVVDAIPSLDAVQLVNCRSFNAQFDRVFIESTEASRDCEEYFGRTCHNVAEWRSAVTQFMDDGYQKWVTKSEFCHAGRNRLKGAGVDVNQQQEGWLSKQFRKNGCVYVEPWVERLEEAGLQFEIAAPTSTNSAANKAPIDFVGVTRLINNHAGQYIGSLFHSNDRLHAAWRDAIRMGKIVCKAAQRAGYHGPMGIDCFRFRTATGHIALRACNDINGRYTMGRVALEMQRMLISGETGLWIHGPLLQIAAIQSSVQNSPGQQQHSDVRAVVTSPQRQDGRPLRTATLLIAGKKADQLSKLVDSATHEAKE